jgi:septal ring factor EnvC (AmiA/AmiB activator)
VLLALPLLAATSSQAQSPSQSNATRLEVDANRRQLDEAHFTEERERVNARLLETAKLIQSSEAQMSAIEARLGELEAQEKTVRGSLEQRQGSISSLLSVMQRMGRNPPPVMITRREDALAMVRSAILLAAAIPELRGQASALTDQLNDLVRVMTDIRTEGEKLRAESAKLEDARTRLSLLMDAKRQSLVEHQEDLAQLRNSATEISKSVIELGDLIQKLDKEVAEKTTLGAYEKQLLTEQQSLAALPSIAPGSAEPSLAAIPPSAKQMPTDDRPASAVLAPNGERLAMTTPGRIKPAVPFHLAKAQLPAQGRRVLSFGDKTQYGSQSKGIVLETRQGAQVISPSDGWVVFAGEFRSYGQLLIINAGGGYHLLLAGMSQIDVQLGQFVLAGEPIGVMSGTAKAVQGKAQDTAPVLYVEFRKEGRPIDPDPWWADGSRKVQG